MGKYLQESYEEALKEIGELKIQLEFAHHHRDKWEQEAVTLLSQNKSLLSIIKQAGNELNKICSLANGSNANEIIIHQKATEALKDIERGINEWTKAT